MAKLEELNDAQLVEVYIQLRDRRAQRKAAYENEDADDRAKQERIEGRLLSRFNETGAESVRTKAGTAYKNVKSSASIADPDAFFYNWVVPNAAWEFIDLKCNKSSVKQYKDAHEDLPPGINWREELSIGVRRS